MTKTWKPVLALFAFGLTLAPMSRTHAQSVPDAQRAIEVERYSAARASLLAATRSGGSDEAYFTLGSLYARLGKADSAAYWFDQGGQKFGGTTTGKISAGAALLQRGNVAGAEAKFGEVLGNKKMKDDEAANASIRIAEAYVLAPESVKDMGKPISYLQNVTGKLRKDDATAYVLLGDAYLKQGGQGGAAMTSYEKAIAANGSLTRAWFRKGLLHVRSRDNNNARDAFKKVIELDANYAPAYAELADLYYRAGLYEDATKMINEYRSRADNSATAQAKYAAFLYLSKDFANAATELEKARLQDSTNVIIRRLQAYAKYEQKDYRGAAAALDRYFKAVPADQTIGSDYVYYGRALSKSGRDDEAMPTLMKALAQDTANKEIQQELAQLYVKKKQYPQAIALYRKRLRGVDKPANTDLYYLGDTYEKAGRFSQADSLYALIAQNNPKFYLAYYKRGIANAGLDPESVKGLARPYFQQFINLTARADSTFKVKADSTTKAGGTAKPFASEVEKYRAQLVQANKAVAFYYYRKGDKASKQQSLPYWQKALELDPADDQSKTAIADITHPTAAPKSPAKKPAGRK